MTEQVAFWTVYCLKHPRTHQTFYVGITTGPLCERLQEHMEKSRDDNPLLASWLAEIANTGQSSIIEQVDSIYGTRKQAEQRERYHVQQVNGLANIQHTPRARTQRKKDHEAGLHQALFMGWLQAHYATRRRPLSPFADSSMSL
jgi:hypothetical protein